MRAKRARSSRQRPVYNGCEVAWPAERSPVENSGRGAAKRAAGTRLTTKLAGLHHDHIISNRSCGRGDANSSRKVRVRACAPFPMVLRMDAHAPEITRAVARHRRQSPGPSRSPRSRDTRRRPRYHAPCRCDAAERAGCILHPAARPQTESCRARCC